MITANKELRDYMKQHKIPYWKLAIALDIAESTLIRWLRVELTEQQNEEFMQKVNEIIAKQEGK